MKMLIKTIQRFWVFWGLAGVCEIPLMMGFSSTPSLMINHRGLCLTLHGLAVVMMFLCEPRGPGWWSKERPWARNAATWTAFFPFFGWMGLGLLYFANLRSPYHLHATVEEEMDFGSPTEKRVVIKGGDPRQRILKELDFMSIGDILAGEDIDLKRGAIERLAEIKTPEAILLLQSFRSNPSTDIRFMVTTALTRIRKEFEEQLHAAKEELIKDNSNTAKRFFLAGVYLQYARSGLLDEGTVRSYVAESLYHLKNATLNEEASVEVFWLLVDIYSEREEWDQVLKVLDAIEQRQKAQPLSIAEKRTEAHYYLGRYSEIPVICNRLRQGGALSGRLSPLADWWGG